MSLLSMLGAGRMPTEADTLIPPTERLICCEFLSCWSVSYDFRSPTRYSSWRKQWFAGSIAVSEEKLIAFRLSNRLVHISFDDHRFDGLSFAADERRLKISHDASLFRQDWSGKLEYHFKTPEASHILDVLLSRASQCSRVKRRERGVRECPGTPSQHR